MSTFLKEKISFLSADGHTQCAGFFYAPTEEPVRAVLQLSHGMCEYVCRYEPMFEVLNAKGFAVCGNDHLGHGYTTDPADYGFMAEKDGYKMVLEDLHTMNTLGHEKWPGVPFFLLGHSMGSFYARWYGELYGDTIDGLLISGTGGPNPALPFGKLLAELLSRVKGPKYHSDLLVKLTTGSYIKAFPGEGPSTSVWLSREPKVWEAYDKDPMCTFSFTASGYRDMLTVYSHVSSKAWADGFPKELPTLIYSGDRDPVGSFGKGPNAVYDALKKAGVRDLQLKLYPQGRHEMHNETNREEVFADITNWMEQRFCVKKV